MSPIDPFANALRISGVTAVAPYRAPAASAPRTSSAERLKLSSTSIAASSGAALAGFCITASFLLAPVR